MSVTVGLMGNFCIIRLILLKTRMLISVALAAGTRTEEPTRGLAPKCWSISSSHWQEGPRHQVGSGLANTLIFIHILGFIPFSIFIIIIIWISICHCKSNVMYHLHLYFNICFDIHIHLQFNFYWNIITSISSWYSESPQWPSV